MPTGILIGEPMSSAFIAAGQAIGGRHGHAADDVVTEVLHHFRRQFDADVADLLVYLYSVINRGQLLRGEFDVNDRPDDLNYLFQCSLFPLLLVAATAARTARAASRRRQRRFTI